MHIFDFVSVKLTVLLIFGIVLGFYWEPPILSVFLFLVLSLSFMGLAWKTQRFFEFPLVASMICIGILITTIAAGRGLPSHYSHFDTGKTSICEVQILDVLKPNRYQ
ncbi:MAG: hypothetical protein AAGD17_11235 [Bacteroidota bacterium]